MSSSNLTSVRFIPEMVLGLTPLAGNFSTARFTGESLSGTPSTTESAQMRVDRLSSGQVLTGLEVSGGLNFELAREPALDDFIESAMLSSWSVLPPVSVDLAIDYPSKKITRAAGDFNDDLEVGDICSLLGFSGATNNTQIQVLEILSPTEIRVAFNDQEGTPVTESATGTSFKRADKIGIGTVKKSYSMEKVFTDLSNKAILYKGMLVNSLSLEVAYGSLITGALEFVGTGYNEVHDINDFITNTRTIDPAATTNSMNGSIDLPLLVSSLGGTMEKVDFCLQNFSLELNNNFTAQTCIGELSPQGQTPGSAAVTVGLSAYLADDTWDILNRKLTQAPFALGGMIKNVDGFYGFYLPAIQVSSEDPQAGGANQDIMMELEGVAKVGSNGEKSLYLFRG